MNLKLTPEQEQNLDWAETVIRTITEKGRNVSAWELDFIDSLDGQIVAQISLSNNQLDKLAEIFHQRL
ncbi:MAG: hypothetical protein H8E87_03255 [FCB group bacterium]|nr:hypothetical protein [FCB group bacterium]